MALRAYADGALFADATGSGPPVVVALHGWGRRGSDFKQALDGIDSLAVDLPGFGASPPPGEVIGAAGYAAMLVGMLQGLESPPVVVGHSFGGTVAVCLASSHPELVGPLVLTGSPLIRHPSRRKPSAGFRMARALNRVGLLSDSRMEQLRKTRGSADYRAADGVMRDILVKVVNESYEVQLAAVRSPVSMIWGEADREVPVAVAEEAAAVITAAGGRAEVEVIAGVGHMLPLEAPDRLRRSIDRALVS